jgi:hypothetical protein
MKDANEINNWRYTPNPYCGVCKGTGYRNATKQETSKFIAKDHYKR